MPTIRNPIEWGLEQFKSAGAHASAVGHSLGGQKVVESAFEPQVRRIAAADLRNVLRKGLEDFAAYRSDVVLICLLYPLVGLVAARLAFGYDLLPLLFPLASGLALVGPATAVGLYEISRRREQGLQVTWADAFAIVRAPAFGAIAVLGLLLFAIFFVWLATAQWIYSATLGPEPPASLSAFLRDLFTTDAGWTMILVGVGVGGAFAALVLAVSVVSFPLLLDREVGVRRAVATSLRAVMVNPGPMAAWGAIVATALIIGSIPLFLGLIVVMPVLGHATWHLYRRVVPR